MNTRPTVILKDTLNWGQGIPGLTGQEICVVLTRGYLSLISAEDIGLASSNWGVMLVKARAYAVTCISVEGKSKTVYLHREIMKPTEDLDVDHRDQHSLFCYKIVDNRRQNLRNVTPSQNLANQRKQTGCSSSFKGVCWHKLSEKWMAYIKVNSKRLYLGIFDSEVDAALVYNDAHRRYFPGISEGLN